LQPQSNADRIANSITKGLTATSTAGKSKAALEILAQEEAYSKRPLGVIEVVRQKGSRNGAFADSDVQTLEAFSQLVAVAIQTARECAERKEGEQYARGLQELVQESSDLLLELNQQELMSRVSDMILKHSCADQVTVFAVAKSDMDEPENSRTLQLVGLDSKAQKLRQKACASKSNLDWPENGLPLVGAKMGKGYVGGAAKTKEVQSTISLNEDKKTVDAADSPITGETAHSVLCVPFMDSCVSSEARGVIQLHRTSRDGFRQHDQDLTTFLGVLLTVGCKNCDRFMPLDSCHKQSKVLKATLHGLSMTAQHSYRNLPMQVIMRCQELFGVTDASLYIYQEENPSVLLRYSLFPATDENAKTKMSPVTPLPLWGVAGQCVLEDKAIILNDIDLDRTIYDREIDCSNTLANRLCCAPMHLADGATTVVGAIMLVLDESSEERFDDYSVYLLDCLTTHISNLIFMWNTVASKRAKESGQGIVPNFDTMEALLTTPANAPRMAGEFITNELEAFELARHMSLQKGVVTTRLGLWGRIQGLGDIHRRKMGMEAFEEWFDTTFDC